MRVADLYEATQLVHRLAAINKDLCALELNPESAGLRVRDTANTWVAAKEPETVEAIRRLLVAQLQREDASLRRRAAQIGLSL